MTIAVQADKKSARFFEAAATGRLLLRECAACGQLSAPYGLGGNQPRVCTNCYSPELKWTEASRTGRVVSWIVIHSKPAPGTVAEQNPVVMVELADGPWLIGPYVSDRSSLQTGLAVTVTFARVGEGEPIPVFEASPAGPDTAG
jgi:uncharacterized protein